MLNKLLSFLRRYKMLQPGDTLICAVSGGADSMALLWAMYLLKNKLQIHLEAAHFNHGLRGSESDRDEAFVRDFCQGYGIVCHCAKESVVSGSKGLEAAARDARYRFLCSLDGKVATAHTANDNAETVLMHLIRGTGLKGLGAIAPVNGMLIRPMLDITRQEVVAFLEEYHIPFIQDSSNDTDQFLRNRLRHHVMPLLEQENPKLVESVSSMALRLREDEALLQTLVQPEDTLIIHDLRQMEEARRCRSLSAFLERSGVKEPSAEHIALAQKLIFSENPSAKASFPGGITICRRYDLLTKDDSPCPIKAVTLPCPGSIIIPQLGLRVLCTDADTLCDSTDCFTVRPQGQITLRCRLPGDKLRLNAGTKSLKELFIDRKIPAAIRMSIPVIADEYGVLGVYGIGPDRSRLAKALPAVQIRFEKI